MSRELKITSAGMKHVMETVATLGVVGLLLLGGTSAYGQEAEPQVQKAVPVLSDAPADGEVAFTVSRTVNQRHLISVPVNQGALVDFNVPIREIRVVNPDIADVSVMSSRQLLVDGKAFGTTQLVATLDGNVQRIFTVAVDLDLERLQTSIEQSVPAAQVKASGMLDTVVLTGTVPDAESAERIMQIAGIYSERAINQMRVAGVQQVLLRCTVAEVNRTATRQMGFNGWMAGDNFPDMFMVQQLGGINPANIGGAKGVSATATIPFGTDLNEGLPLRSAPTLSFGFPRMQMQVFIKALRENNLLRVLAEPNLVTISGAEAEFLAGGEIPIPVAQRDSVTIEFREYGVRLNFTPTVLGPNVIRLRVAPEVSEPDFSTAVTLGGFVVPGLTQRKVETVVELATGQTFAIGGLLSEKTRAVSSRLPALGDVPVLGALFSSVEYQSNESELVVLVTPELVEPLNPGQVAYVPGADHIAPNDWELFGLGKIDGEGTVGQGAPARGGEDGNTHSAAGTPTAFRLRGPVGPADGDEGM